MMLKVQEIIQEGEVYTFNTLKVNQFDISELYQGEGEVLVTTTNVIVVRSGKIVRMYIKQAYVTK
jgi:hypothetical protein